MAYLVIQLEGKPPIRRKLDKDVELGRGLGAEVWISDSRASRQHCKIFRENNAWMIEDMNSANGTFINGEKIARQTLADGEVIQIGSTRIIFHNSDLNDDRPSRPDKPTDLSDSQRIDMHGTVKLTHIDRPLPKVSVDTGDTVPQERPKKSIAFDRPPAQPILPPKHAPKLEEQRKTWWKRLTGK